MINFKAITALYPQIVTLRGSEAYDQNDNRIAYDRTAVDAWIDPDLYKEQRAAEYPPIVDQLDTIFHDGIDAWKAQIQAVKDKYPKGQA